MYKTGSNQVDGDFNWTLRSLDRMQRGSSLEAGAVDWAILVSGCLTPKLDPETAQACQRVRASPKM